MDLTECVWCGAEIEGPVIRDKGLTFCSEACHAAWATEEADLELDELEDDPEEFDDDLDLDDDL